MNSFGSFDSALNRSAITSHDLIKRVAGVSSLPNNVLKNLSTSHDLVNRVAGASALPNNVLMNLNTSNDLIKRVAGVSGLSSNVLMNLNTSHDLVKRVAGVSDLSNGVLKNLNTSYDLVKRVTGVSGLSNDALGNSFYNGDFQRAVRSIQHLMPATSEIERFCKSIDIASLGIAGKVQAWENVAHLANLGSLIRSAPYSPNTALITDFMSSKRSGSVSLIDSNRSLTALPEPYFSRALRETGIVEKEIPRAHESHKQVGKPDSISEDTGRLTEAFNLISGFEIELRQLLSVIMEKTFGVSWHKRRIPGDMLKSWKEKKDTALNKGESDQPLIAFSDFSDYIKIFCRGDNWKEVFSKIFCNETDIRASMERLAPLRIATMHCRMVSKDELLIIAVETRRVLNALRKFCGEL
jgi:hypothetical protein